MFDRLNRWNCVRDVSAEGSSALFQQASVYKRPEVIDKDAPPNLRTSLRNVEFQSFLHHRSKSSEAGVYRQNIFKYRLKNRLSGYIWVRKVKGNARRCPWARHSNQTAYRVFWESSPVAQVTKTTEGSLDLCPCLFRSTYLRITSTTSQTSRVTPWGWRRRGRKGSSSTGSPTGSTKVNPADKPAASKRCGLKDEKMKLNSASVWQTVSLNCRRPCWEPLPYKRQRLNIHNVCSGADISPTACEQALYVL